MDKAGGFTSTLDIENATVGFVGLGNMGNPMCSRLDGSGKTVYAYDASPEAIERITSTGITTAESLRSIAENAEIVFMSLPNSSVVEEVLLADDGLLAELRAGSVVVDMSSSKPSSTRYLAKELNRKRIAMLDAPVSGGVARARSGELAIMVGGDQRVYEACLPLLELMGEKIFHVGDAGSGHLAKSLNNLLSATTLASVSEAIVLGKHLGLEPSVLIDVINSGTGRSNSTEVKFPRYILNKAFDAGFTTQLYNKDISIAIESAEEEGLPMPVGQSVAEIWQQAVDAGYGPYDHTKLYSYIEEMVAKSINDTD